MGESVRDPDPREPDPRDEIDTLESQTQPQHLTRSDPSPKRSQTPRRIHDYEIIEVIGRGGMGIVYKARQVSLNRTVALKTISGEAFATDDTIIRFQAEATAAASLDHPNIVSIHEIGEHEGRPYFSMDYVEGYSMAELITETEVSTRESARVTAKIARAIEHAHQHRVLHRDLKPANILLDSNGEPRVADFGLAKLTEQESGLTRSGQVLGTPNYMSPEQAEPRPGAIGPCTDVYGVGAILYASLTGQPPFAGGNYLHVLRDVVESNPVPPRKLNRLVDRDLETICLKCLEKETADRYESAIHVAEDLERFLNGDPIVARPPGYAKKLWHWMRRPQRAMQSVALSLLLGAFFLVCGMAGLGILLFEWVETDKPAQAAVVVALDFAGAAMCIILAFGIAKGLRIAMWFGVLSGGITFSLVFFLVCVGFEAGGMLPDPVMRVIFYSIFGFVGVLLTAISCLSLISHQASQARLLQESTTSSPTGSTKDSDPYATTDDVSAKESE